MASSRAGLRRGQRFGTSTRGAAENADRRRPSRSVGRTRHGHDARGVRQGQEEGTVRGRSTANRPLFSPHLFPWWALSPGGPPPGIRRRGLAGVTLGAAGTGRLRRLLGGERRRSVIGRAAAGRRGDDRRGRVEPRYGHIPNSSDPRSRDDDLLRRPEESRGPSEELWAPGARSGCALATSSESRSSATLALERPSRSR